MRSGRSGGVRLSVFALVLAALGCSGEATTAPEAAVGAVARDEPSWTAATLAPSLTVTVSGLPPGTSAWNNISGGPAGFVPTNVTVPADGGAQIELPAGTYQLSATTQVRHPATGYSYRYRGAART